MLMKFIAIKSPTVVRSHSIMQEHLGNCDYRDVQCTQCGQYIQQLDMEAHQKELCAMRPTTCPHCSKDVPTQQLQVSDGCLMQIYFSANGHIKILLL